MHKIRVLPLNQEYYANDGDRLLDVLKKSDSRFVAPCGGKGVCGKCKVKIIQGQVGGAELDANQNVLACKSIVKGDLTIELPTSIESGLAEFLYEDVQTHSDGLGIILDIGTTTIASCLIDLSSGATLRKHAGLNPQAVFGADVLSRIQACNEGHLADLQQVVIKETKKFIEELADGKPVKQLVIGANTTMLHLFLGVDPKTIGVAPFTPVFTATQVVKGEQLGLPVDTVRLLPSASAYIGSDVTAGVLACGLRSKNKTELFIDVGTNGEVVLSHNGVLYATSTAAGPALEGACIECGIGGVHGAIDKVKFEGGKINVDTIGGIQPKGICGSGLIDAIALFVTQAIIDESGTWQADETSLTQYKKDDKFYLSKNVYISQADIRQFQLAKSAICAGIKTLLNTCGIDESQVQTTYIAGGLGYYMNLDNAVIVGLIPKGLKNSLQSVGNSCLSGARLCLLLEDKQAEIERLAKEIQIVDLSSSRVFQDEYVSSMWFDVE